MNEEFDKGLMEILEKYSIKGNSFTVANRVDHLLWWNDEPEGTYGTVRLSSKKARAKVARRKSIQKKK